MKIDRKLNLERSKTQLIEQEQRNQFDMEELKISIDVLTQEAQQNEQIDEELRLEEERLLAELA